jgi:hypothetical protein
MVICIDMYCVAYQCKCSQVLLDILSEVSFAGTEFGLCAGQYVSNLARSPMYFNGENGIAFSQKKYFTCLALLILIPN